MELSIVQVPYDSGHFGRRMGRGPLSLVDGGLLDLLEEDGHDPRLVEVRLPAGFHSEVGAAAVLQGMVRDAVAGALHAGRTPVVLAGNCNLAALGSVAALGPASTAVVWFDAHGDFNTPDTSPSGFFDGMALSVLTGNSWSAMASSLAGFEPVPEERVALLGVRDLDPGEAELLEESAVARVAAAALLSEGVAALGPVVERVVVGAERLYLHVDLDVLDPEALRANPYAASGGLGLDELIGAAAALRDHLDPAAVAMTSYDGTDERGVAVARRLLATALG